jgi:Tol biopolymer transport system component
LKMTVGAELPAGTQNIGDVDVSSQPSTLFLHDRKTYKVAVFDASASGNLVAAVAGKVIKLHALTIQAQGTVVVNLNNGAAGTSLMEWSFQAREGAVVPMANAPAYWAITGVNTALYVTLSAAVVVTITAIYSDDDAS